MTNRQLDAAPQPCTSPETLPPLPIIDWSSIGQSAPEVVDLGTPSEDAPLPEADIVVITWTSAEWSALDHVFINSDKERYRTSTEFHKQWHYRKDDKYVEGAYELWGFYRMVKITTAGGIEQRVLLFKSSAHLSHPPYCTGLIAMVNLIIDEVKPKRLYTIGTAGGASLEDRLGDTVVTNAGHIEIEKEENACCNLNGVSVVCNTWYPSFNLIPDVESKLLMKLSEIVNNDELEYMLCQTINDPKHGDPSWKGEYTVQDMVNAAIDPANLSSPKGLDKKEVPLLTTDYYYIANGSDSSQFSALEMDDAVIGFAAGKRGVDYVFVRNISDPVVPDTTQAGKTIPTELRETWSGQIYENFGLYTSMNGALITWATIAGDPTKP